MKLTKVFNKTVLGIDNSTNSTAFALFKGSQLIDYGEFIFPGKTTFDRIIAMPRILQPLRDMVKEVDIICIEKTAMINNRQTVIFLAMAAGAVIGLISNENSKIIEIPALTYQSYIGNNIFTRQEKTKLKDDNPGKSSAWLKEEMRKMRKQRTLDFVNKKYNLNIDNNNIGDALALTTYCVEELI